MENTHLRYLNGNEVIVPNKSKHLHFDMDGSTINNPINVKYAWFTEKNRRIVIAYIRNYRNGTTIYAASILRTDLPTHHLYSKKSYHRYIATDRLYYYPIYIQTSINVHQSFVETEIRNSININGLSSRVCENWDEDADYLFDNAQYMNIINPFINTSNTKIEKIKKEIVDILPYNAEYIWYRTKKKSIICVYNVDRCNNNVTYAQCIFKPNKNVKLTTSQKLGHVKTAISRFIKKPTTIYVNVSTKKALHNYLKDVILYGEKPNPVDSLQLLCSNYSEKEDSTSDISSITNISSITDISSTTNKSVASNIAVVDGFTSKYSYLQEMCSSAECDSPKSTNSITINHVKVVEKLPTRTSTRIKNKPKKYIP